MFDSAFNMSANFTTAYDGSQEYRPSIEPTSKVAYANIGLLALALVGLVLTRLRNRFGTGLNRVPGPEYALWSRVWRLYDVYRGQAMWTAIGLHKKYGKIVRIGPKHISVADAKAIPVIYSVTKRFSKTEFYPSQSISWDKKPQMNLFSTRDEKYHDTQRRKVANTYSLTSVLGMERSIDGCINLLMSRLSGFAEASKPLDLGAWLEYYAFDVVGEITFSRKMGFLEQGKDVDGMIAGIERMLKYSSRVGQIPELHYVLLGNPLFPIFMPQMESWNQVVMFTLKTMNERASIERNKELDVYQVQDLGKDMLSLWSNVKRNDPDRMTTRDIIVHTSTNVFAGSGTTSIALRGIIYFLCRNPDVKAKLMRQVDEADQQGLLSTPPTYKECKEHLPYVEALMREIMRIHSGIGLPLERHVPKGGIEICGHHLPEGTVVGVNAWVMHHDPEVFPDPESFYPERWLESTPEQKADMERSFFSFGHGPRSCLGRNIAYVEIEKCIAQLFREFDVELTHPEKNWFVQDVFMVQQRNVICNLIPRKDRPVKEKAAN